MKPPRDFVTADLRGLKARLEERAAVQRVSVSLLVRRAVERELGGGTESLGSNQSTDRSGTGLRKINLRLTPAEVGRLDLAAAREEISRSALVGRLIDGGSLARPGDPAGPQLVSALALGNAEMATLSRGIHRLATLLARADIAAALRYRAMLDRLDGDVRSHLEVSARALSLLKPARPPSSSLGRPTRRHRS